MFSDTVIKKLKDLREDYRERELLARQGKDQARGIGQFTYLVEEKIWHKAGHDLDVLMVQAEMMEHQEAQRKIQEQRHDALIERLRYKPGPVFKFKVNDRVKISSSFTCNHPGQGKTGVIYAVLKTRCGTPYYFIDSDTEEGVKYGCYEHELEVIGDEENERPAARSAQI